MTLPTTLPAAVLETILGRLAVLFLSGSAGNLTTARCAAVEMLAAYQPETAPELRLAANIISFSFHALEALSQAATPDMPLNKILRLRGGAVSLSRESARADHRLERLQQARRDGKQPETTEAAQPAPAPAIKVEKAIALVEATRQAISTNPRNGAPIWSKSHQQREAARRITENLRKNQAAHAAAAAPST